MKTKTCALMGCELDKDDLSLGQIFELYSKEKEEQPPKSREYIQVLMLLDMGFKKEDILCKDCFWK